MSYLCRYILLDDTRREVVIFPDGFAKGYFGEGSRGALTIDSWLYLLGIPRCRRCVSEKFAKTFFKYVGEEPVKLYKINMPEPRYVTYDPKPEVIKKIIQKVHHTQLPSAIEDTRRFSESWENVSLDQALDLLDFHA